MYSFGERALNLPLKKIIGTGNEQREEDTTVGKLLQELSGQEFAVDDDIISIDISTQAGSLTLRGPMFNHRIATVLLELQKEGIRPLASRWFWYDKDDSGTEPSVSYTFFVAHEDKIVRDAVSFLDYLGSGFDPTVFEAGDDDTGPRWDFAWAAHWYRRFYRETTIGKLMVLRPDLPLLHYFPEGRETNSSGTGDGVLSGYGVLRQIRTALWLAVVLLAVIAFLLFVK
jgi:hypothetical protein